MPPTLKKTFDHRTHFNHLRAGLVLYLDLDPHCTTKFKQKIKKLGKHQLPLEMYYDLTTVDISFRSHLCDSSDDWFDVFLQPRFHASANVRRNAEDIR